MGVAVVTDSTALLDADDAEAHGITVVPLQVVIGTSSYDEGSSEAAPERVADALRRGVSVSTSRPTPSALAEAYRAAADAGAEAVVSVHLSGDMSGTFESAQLAARDAPLPVLPVDTRQVGFATGYAALAARAIAAAGGSAEAAATAALEVAAASTSLFYVDSLEWLRKGGRVGAAAALIGNALSVKPLLRVEHGRVDAFEKVRTAGKALARLADLAVGASAAGPEVDVGVAHLDSPERAAALAAALADRLAAPLAGRPVRCTQLGAVLGAHAGPGMVAVCVTPRRADSG